MLNNLFAVFGIDFARQLSAPMKTPASTSYDAGNGTTVIDLAGTLSRDGSLGGSSTDAVRSELQRLASNPRVDRIILRVNSPGGQSIGCTALYDTVVEVAKQKPIIGVIEDIGASAAYFAVAGCTRIVANRSSLIGGIGTYAVVEDVSGMADAIGVKVHVIKAGKFKGMAEAGTTITPEQLEELQRLVNDINEQFLNAVATGRKLTGDKLQIVSDSRVWIARDAKRYSLIDEIGTLEDVLASPVSAPSSAMQRHQNPSLDFQSRLEAQRRQRNETFEPSYKQFTLRDVFK